MTRPQFDKVIFWLEGAFRTSLTAHERDSYFSLLEEFSASAVMRQAMAYAMREDADILHFPRPRDLKPSKDASRPKAKPGDSMVRYVRCMTCRAVFPITHTAEKDPSSEEGKIRITTDQSLFSGHVCKPSEKWCAKYDNDALGRIRRAAVGRRKDATLGKLSAAIVEDIDAETARRA